MAHQKHAKLKRPAFGNFGRNEWAIIGTPCGNLKRIAFEVTKALSNHYKVAYLDADHKEASSEGSLKFGANLEATDKISHHRLDFIEQPNNFQWRQTFNLQDLVLVNGNHFKANQQIVVIDPRKEDSLKRKLDRLTDVKMLLLEGDAPIPDFLKNHIPDIDQLPIFQTTDTQKVADYIQAAMMGKTPIVKGVVLAGGKSQRMGTDKGALDYHGVPQRDYLMGLMSECCEAVYLSCREEQVAEFSRSHAVLSDKFVGLGPFGAILTAFQEDPDAAWLVVACDMPFVDANVLEYLLQNRSVSEIATAFHNKETGFPDPLIAVWEPRSYPILLQFLSMGYSCPRKVLINSSIKEVQPQHEQTLRNANTPEDYKEIKDHLLK